MTRKNAFVWRIKEKLLALQSKLKQKQVTKKHSRILYVSMLGLDNTVLPKSERMRTRNNTKGRDRNDKRSETQPGWMYSSFDSERGKLVKV